VSNHKHLAIHIKQSIPPILSLRRPRLILWKSLAKEGIDPSIPALSNETVPVQAWAFYTLVNAMQSAWIRPLTAPSFRKTRHSMEHVFYLRARIHPLNNASHTGIRSKAFDACFVDCVAGLAVLVGEGPVDAGWSPVSFAVAYVSLVVLVECITGRCCWAYTTSIGLLPALTASQSR
jgi:hypothetical protein